jgi:hypothetical protein
MKELIKARKNADNLKAAYMDSFDTENMEIIRRRLVEWQAAENRYSELATEKVFKGTITLEQATNGTVKDFKRIERAEASFLFSDFA